MAITQALVEGGVRYSLPSYEGMADAILHLLRPHGEGQTYMPPFMQKAALKL
jgi:hypothetical protein